MTVWLSLDLCGFGGNLGLFPELRLGLVRVGWCRGAITEHLEDARDRLRRVLSELRRSE